MNSQFRKGTLELCVLSLIHDGDRYGYELVEEISKHIEITEGTIYPILRRLTNEKYCKTYLKESQEGPPRKYYQITTRGERVYQDQLKEWMEFNSNVRKLLGIGKKRDGQEAVLG